MSCISFQTVRSIFSRIFGAAQDAHIPDDVCRGEEPFPFLHLPLINQEMVMEYMQFAEVITLSLTSRKLKHFVKAYGPKIEHLEWTASGEHHTFTIHPKTGHELRMLVAGVSGHEWNVMRANRRLYCTPFPIQNHLYTASFLYGNYLPIYFWMRECSRYSVAAGHFLGAFRVEKVSLKASDVPQTEFLGAVLKWRPRFETLVLEQKRQRSLSPMTLKSLLGDLEVDQFVLDWKIRTFPVSADKLRYREMTIEKADWMSFESLIAMPCAVLKASHVKITSPQLNQFLLKWKSGGFEELRLLRLEYTESCLHENHVLYGIEFTEMEEQVPMDNPFLWVPKSKVIAVGGKRAKVSVTGRQFLFQMLR